MMEIDSTSEREGPLVDWVESYLTGAEWRVWRLPVTPGRDDIFATCVDAPLVTLSTHLDTLWGRGACDAKGIAAAMIVAADRLRTTGVPVALLFVVGEEVTHDGAVAANRVPTTSRVLIN